MAFKMRDFAMTATLLLTGCFGKQINIPDVADNVVAAQVQQQEIADTAPGFGVALSNYSFEVSLEPADSQKVRVGETAWVTPAGSELRAPIQAIVTRVSRSASSEVGQALAWLQASRGAPIQSGEFVSARVTLSRKKNVLTIPVQAVYVKDGATLALKQTTSKDGKISYTPTEIELGVHSNGVVEIVTGLELKDKVAVSGGIGYLYPNFKEADDE